MDLSSSKASAIILKIRATSSSITDNGEGQKVANTDKAETEQETTCL